MWSDELAEKVLKTFHFLNETDEKIFEEFKNNAIFASLKTGDHVFWEGDHCQNLALLVSGTVRVYKIGESGREITLYRIKKGEGCMLTISCILSDGKFPAMAQIEEDTEALIISAGVFRDWVDRYPVWRSFVCGLLSQRLASIIMTVEEIAFRRMDKRIGEFLFDRYRKYGSELKITHQEIALELGSAREVVSRILKEFEQQGKIKQSRGIIQVCRPEDLRKERYGTPE